MKLPVCVYLFIAAAFCVLPIVLYGIYHFVICFWQRVCELYAESGFVGIAAVLGALGIIFALIGLIEATQNTEF